MFENVVLSRKFDSRLDLEVVKDLAVVDDQPEVVGRHIKLDNCLLRVLFELPRDVRAHQPDLSWDGETFILRGIWLLVHVRHARHARDKRNVLIEAGFLVLR